MAQVFIGLGANLDNPKHQLAVALQALAELADSQLMAVSSVYGSKPLGPQDQPDYLNCVAHLQTQLTPTALLDALQQQEQQQGRVKFRHWGERCIDLDILLYDQLTLVSERLTIPHQELAKRSFVVEPLREIAPDLVLPDGRVFAELEPEFGGELQRLHPPLIDL